LNNNNFDNLYAAMPLQGRLLNTNKWGVVVRW